MLPRHPYLQRLLFPRVDFSFPDNVTLSAGTTYYFVLYSTNLNNPELIIGSSGTGNEWRYCPGCSGADWQNSGYYFSFQINTVGDYTNQTTRIVSFTPADKATTATTSVPFNLSVYINSNDLGFWSSLKLSYCYQPQPVGTEHCFLDSVNATTSGFVNFSYAANLSPGNYIANADIITSYLGGIFINPFSGGLSNATTSVSQYHQFVASTSTFLGNLFQNGIGDIQNNINNLSATSSVASLGYCNPLGSWDIIQCLYALFIPTSSQLQDSLNSFYNDFLIRAPWGYAVLAGKDLSGFGSVATTSLSSANLSVTLPNTGVFSIATSTSALKGKTITFIDWNVMASSTQNNYWGSAWSSINNFINLMLGAGFIFWLWRYFVKHMTP